jgi:hypothetical protein
MGIKGGGYQKTPEERADKVSYRRSIRLAEKEGALN